MASQTSSLGAEIHDMLGDLDNNSKAVVKHLGEEQTEFESINQHLTHIENLLNTHAGKLGDSSGRLEQVKEFNTTRTISVDEYRKLVQNSFETFQETLNLFNARIQDNLRLSEELKIK